jgi:RHS repeat-associated protein
VPDYVVRSGNAYRIVSDQLGSPVLAVNLADSGDVPFRAEYTAFGEVTGDGLDWMAFGFAGGHYDPDTKLVRFGARDYDPIVGRWLRKDPARFGGDGPNPYPYALSDPMDFVDFEGSASRGASGDPNALSRLCTTKGAPCAPYQGHPSRGQVGWLHACRKTWTKGPIIRFTCSYKYPDGDQCTFFNGSFIGICNSFLPGCGEQ